MDEKFINHLLRAGKKIYKLIQNGLDESYYDIVKIGAGGDKSTKIDLVAEEIFVSNLKAGQASSPIKGRLFFVAKAVGRSCTLPEAYPSWVSTPA